jgi:hypothetical protein
MSLWIISILHFLKNINKFSYYISLFNYRGYKFQLQTISVKKSYFKNKEFALIVRYSVFIQLFTKLFTYLSTDYVDMFRDIRSQKQIMRLINDIKLLI